MEKKLTRAEEKALEAYPISAPPTYLDGHYLLRQEAYIKGYQQAEKDTIERAVTWLKVNANKYIVDLTETYPDAPVNIIVGGMCWEDLKEYMKNESF